MKRRMKTLCPVQKRSHQIQFHFAFVRPVSGLAESFDASGEVVVEEGVEDAAEDDVEDVVEGAVEDAVEDVDEDVDGDVDGDVDEDVDGDVDEDEDVVAVEAVELLKT